MAKATSTLGLALAPREPGVPAYRWLCDALRGEILGGRLRPGARLPATRDLAAAHGLSRGTVVAAFEQLAAEGYVEGTVGSGTYVSAVLPEQLLQAPRARRGAPAAARPPRRRLSSFGKRVRLFAGYDGRPTRAFRANMPALDLFPVAVWSQLASRRARSASARMLLACPALGYRPLREAVADYLRASRGVACSAEQVAIVGGVQEAIDIVARIVLDRGDGVVIEDPGYSGAALAFEALGARVLPAPLDDEGIAIDERKHAGAKLAYVTPAHQFPLGIAMSLARRLETIEWARRTGALILEDDYDSEYRYAGRPLPALQGLDRHGVVLYAGSFSKVLFPSLRLGYLVVPPDLIEPVEAAKSLMNRHASLFDQAVLCDFITAGHFGRHVRRTREVYASRLGVLLERARAELSGVLDVSAVEAGLQTVGWLRRGIGAADAVRAAARHDVDVTPLSDYAVGGAVGEGLQLGFAAVDEREIRRGVRELAIALGWPRGREALRSRES